MGDPILSPLLRLRGRRVVPLLVRLPWHLWALGCSAEKCESFVCIRRPRPPLLANSPPRLPEHADLAVLHGPEGVRLGVPVDERRQHRSSESRCEPQTQWDLHDECVSDPCEEQEQEVCVCVWRACLRLRL
jgi:hypothetical protein